MPLDSCYRNIHPENVAVVLACTTGARLFPLTTTTNSTTTAGQEQQQQPKHLLPMAGIAALERLLNGALRDFTQVFVAIAAEDQTTVHTIFEQPHASWQTVTKNDKDKTSRSATVAGTTTATTTTSSSSSSHIAPQTHSVWEPKSSTSSSRGNHTTRVTVVRMPEECPGSAEVLRQLEGLLPRRAHVLVLPGDLVVTQGSTTIDAVLQAHRQGQKHPSTTDTDSGPAACTVLLHDVGEQDEQGVPLKESAKAKKGGLARDVEDIEYMALSSSSLQSTTTTNTARLIWKQGKMDAEQDEDFTLTGQTPKLRLPKARLRASNGGVVKVRSDWNDLHVYVLSPWVVRLVQAKTTIVNLQRDLLPLLIRRQFLGKVETFGQGVEPHRVLEILEEEDHDNINSINNNNHDASALATSPGMLNISNNALSPKDANTSGTAAPLTASLMKPNQTYTVLAHVGTGAMRFSSLPAYLYASKDLLQNLVDANKQKQDPHCLRLPEQSTTNPKFMSLLLPGAQIGDKPTFKASIVGRHCRLGNKCRLNNVILMDNVQLGDNVVLQNTIVATGAVIGDNVSLNDCQVAAGVKVESGTKEKGEVLVDTLTLG